MSRRTRPRVVWLPGTNANSVGGGAAGTEDNHVQTMFVSLASPVSAGDSSVGEIPLVIDSQDDVLDPVTSLSDIENSGYRLRRIVGKIFLRYEPEGAVDSPERVLVTAGIIVRRSDAVTGISYAVGTANATLVNPQFIHNDGDPWVWRRSWIFKQTRVTDLNIEAGSNYGFNAGSVADGPHVDAKTARIVSSEERLFLDVGVLALDSSNDSGVVVVHADLRCLASMRTSAGNRRNASR